MKFLCLRCDEPMKLMEASPPKEGSMSLHFECPACASAVAMQTNADETQVLASLGVEFQPARGAPAAADARPKPGEGGEEEPRWTEAAEKRLKKVPFFVRPMAKNGIERFAREHGYREIDEKVMDEAKGHFGM